MAQSNVGGSIFGTTDNAGATVVITNSQTGAVRSATVDPNGRFQVPGVPAGTYKIDIIKDGRAVESKTGILVTIGSGSEVLFGDRAMETVVVTGAAVAAIDVSSTDTRSVFTAEELDKLTVKRSIEEVALLAPGTVRGDSRYNSNRGMPTASFGGSGANENAFYINGYAVTDPIKGLGSSSLPFNSIAQYQLLTGGFGAEFGRSTGGVVNIVTKSGSNDWNFGVNISSTPDSLSAHSDSSFYPANGTARDGRLWNDNKNRKLDSTIYSAYLSGPILEDKLFFYLGTEYEDRDNSGPSNFTRAGTAIIDGPTGWQSREITVPRYIGKLDYNIADGHHLELTGISDVRKEERRYYSYFHPNSLTPRTNADDQALPDMTKGSTINSGYDYKDGGELYIAKYTGEIMENLIVTALYGTQKNDHEILPFGYDSSITTVRDDRPNASQRYGNFTTLPEPGAYDKSEGYRFDIEWLIGDHDVRVGYDVQNLAVFDGTTTGGPGYWWVYDNTDLTEGTIEGSGGARLPGGNGDYVYKAVSRSGGKFTTDQWAYFIEDRWQVTDTVLLSLGLRNENFENFNSDKQTFLDMTDQWAPRLGISWDVKGDSSLRAFANAGRYHLAIPLNLAFRQVGGSTNTSEYYSFTGIDPNTGEPLGTVALGDGPFSPNGEYGQAIDPNTSAANGLKGYYQDEFTVGVEATVFGNLKAGARFTYRDLKSQIDDNCDPRAPYNWAIANGKGSGVDVRDGFTGADEPNGLDDLAEDWAASMHCKIINPGEDNTLQLTDPTSGEYVMATITAAQWGLPKLKRTYQGLDLFLERPLRDGWYGKIEYTLSKSEGNAEGMLYSDSGQEDVAVTANWDYPELMVGANGPLPNDRRHQIKAFGYYEFTPEIAMSATLTAASGRPRSPAGYYTGDALVQVPIISGTVEGGDPTATDIFYNYIDYGGPYYHYKGGEVAGRGSAGRLPWTTSLDLGLAYTPGFLNNQLKASIDVFNVFNTQEVQSYVEYADANGAGTPYHSYQKILSYNTPRSVRFQLSYDFK